jgi:hypothetical protein
MKYLGFHALFAFTAETCLLTVRTWVTNKGSVWFFLSQLRGCSLQSGKVTSSHSVLSLCTGAQRSWEGGEASSSEEALRARGTQKERADGIYKDFLKNLASFDVLLRIKDYKH